MEEANFNKTEHRSLTELLNEGLGRENVEALEELFAHFKDHVRTGAEYVEENPKEAMIIAASVGLAAWVMFATKPGRKFALPAFVAFLPNIKSWLTNAFSSPTPAVSNTAEPAIQHH